MRGPVQSGPGLHSLVFDLGSRGPSTVTLMALLYVVTCGGDVDTVMVSVKLFPAGKEITTVKISEVSK